MITAREGPPAGIGILVGGLPGVNVGIVPTPRAARHESIRPERPSRGWLLPPRGEGLQPPGDGPRARGIPASAVSLGPGERIPLSSGAHLGATTKTPPNPPARRIGLPAARGLRW